MGLSVFSPEDMANALGEGGMDSLKGMAVDKGTAFLQGKVTSAFTDLAKAQSSLIGTAANATGMVSGAMAMANPMAMQEMATQIGMAAMNKVTSEMQSMITSLVSDIGSLMMQIPQETLKWTMKAFNDNKMSMADFIKEIAIDPEIKAQLDVEKLKLKDENLFMSKVQKKMGDAQKFMDEKLGKVNKVISKINEYMVEGPEFVNQKIDEAICESLAAVQYYKDEIVMQAKMEILGGVKPIYKKDEDGNVMYETYPEDVWEPPIGQELEDKKNIFGDTKTTTEITIDENGNQLVTKKAVKKERKLIHKKGDIVYDGFIKKKIRDYDAENEKIKNDEICKGFCYNAGTPAGKFMADQYNIAMKKAAEALTKKLNAQKKKATIKIAVNVQKGILNIKKLLGI